MIVSILSLESVLMALIFDGIAGRMIGGKFDLSLELSPLNLLSISNSSLLSYFLTLFFIF